MTMWDYRTDLEALDRDLVGYDVEATDGKHRQDRRIDL